MGHVVMVTGKITTILILNLKVAMTTKNMNVTSLRDTIGINLKIKTENEKKIREWLD